jgi:hypothetical protein
MKHCILVITALLLPLAGWATHSHANDDSDTAGYNASCNASFQEDCVAEVTLASDTVAAPVGIIGGGAVETLILTILLGGTLRARASKRRGKAHRSARAMPE